MLFRSIAAAAVLLSAQSTAAQDLDLRAQVAAFVQPTNEARTQVAVAQLRAAGFDPTTETFTGGNRQTGEMEGRNVVVLIPGMASGGKEILLTAHYDAVKLRDGAMSQGVVDNAGSVVGVIEAAKAIRERRLAHDVRIILFDQEELGLIGARKWIEAHGLTNVAAVVNSDVAGYGDTLMYGQNNGAQSAFVTRVVQETCAERAMQCVGFPIYPPSDDRAFSAAGAPVVSLGFQDEVGAHQMWLAFNGGETNGLAEGFVPRVFQLIHSADDSMEQIDPATQALAGAVYADIVARLDGQLAANR